MSPKKNRLASVGVAKVSEGWELDLVPLGGQEPFHAMLSSGRMLLGPFSREDVRTIRDSLSEFLKGEKRH
ncbi:MAG TPA: hypothetical protein VK638_00630 [Edaphobacter sp.]|nr:hypothetical protein [Edaphobacter sp.]